MKILQFSDIHVSAIEDRPMDGIDTRKNLVKMLGHLSTQNHDLIVFTGDTCFDKPQEYIYHWVAQQFKDYIGDGKIRIIAGNHDDSRMLVQGFSTIIQKLDHLNEHGEYYYQERVKGAQFFYLDTSKGSCSKEQKDWLVGSLAKLTDPRVIIFMHHPPLLAGVKFLDTHHAFKDIEDFKNIFSEFPDIQFSVFCGHYHTDRIIVERNVQVYITPSCYLQIDASSSSFKVDHMNIGYRLIDIKQDRLITSVCYIG